LPFPKWLGPTAAAAPGIFLTFLERFMNSKILGGLALVVALSAAPAALAAQWQPLTSTEGGFTVMMPAGYVNEKTPVDMSGAAKANNISYRVEADGAYWGVSTTDYPQAASRDPKKMLDNARDGALKRWNGTMRSDKSMTVSGKPAREVVYDVTDQGNAYTVRQRFVLVSPQRVVQQAYVGQRGSETGADAEKFFASLQLK
jgi:hypothetical protein